MPIPPTHAHHSAHTLTAAFLIVVAMLHAAHHTHAAALMAHAHHAAHALTTAFLIVITMFHATHHAHASHAAALFFCAMFSGCRCGFLAMTAATAVRMENFHELYGVYLDAFKVLNIVVRIGAAIKQHGHRTFGNTDGNRFIWICCSTELMPVDF